MGGNNILRQGLAGIILLVFLVNCAWADSAQFSADISMDLQGVSSTGVIYVSDTNYRMDLVQDGKKITVLVDGEAGRTRILLHDLKQYIEMKSDDPASLMNDPFQSLMYTESFAEKKSLGTEAVGGFKFDKYKLMYGDQDIITFWVDNEIDFPIKIINNAVEGTFTELSNIKIAPVDESLFATPDDYAEMTVPGEDAIEAPDWAVDIPSAPVLTPPFEYKMSNGDMARIEVVPGKAIWLKADNRSEGLVKAKAIPFKDSVPLKEISMYNNFAQQGVICVRRDEAAVEADEIVIRVFEGGLTVVGKYFPMQETLASAGESFAYRIISQEYIVARFVNTAETESELVFSYSSEGKELSEADIGPETFRTITIKPGKTSQRTLNPSGDTMIVRIRQGSVTIKLGQYDSFEW